ncbi:MAG: ATP-binding protein [Phycisphaerae bacterium]|jgi:two-component system sensor histidine kinase CpxA
MRHLFIRIFLPVLLAVLVAFGVGMGIASLLFPRPPEHAPRPLESLAEDEDGPPPLDPGQDSGGAMLREGERAVTRLVQAGDLPGARAEIARLNESSEISAYLLDGRGTDLDGAELPQQLRELVDEALLSGQSLISGGGPHMRIARLITTADRGRFVFAADIDPSNKWAWRRAVLLAAQFVAVTGALGIVSYFLARHITRPVLRLRAAVRQVAEGDLEQRVGPTFGRRRDELAELGRDFDAMAGRIANLLATQQRLLRDISHELRSPLTRQAVALEIARRHIAPEGVGMLDRATRESERLSELVGELLTLTRLESDLPAAEIVSVPLDELVRRVVDDVGFEVAPRDRTVHVQTCDACTTPGVPELLRRAVENVLRNATTYAPEGSAVEVNLAAGLTTASITVRDHGPGVPPGELSEIFRPFYRVGEGRDRRSGGIGLGLSIAERAVRSHGGSIAARNAADGGLIVEILLPINTAPAARAT